MNKTMQQPNGPGPSMAEQATFINGNGTRLIGAADPSNTPKPSLIQEQGDPPLPSLAAQVAKLERRVAALDYLCSDMLAFMEINLNRGLLNRDVATCKLMLESWATQRRTA